MRLLLCSLILTAAACRCGPSVGQAKGELALDWSDRGQKQTDRDAHYDFGRVTTGTTGRVSVTVRNLGLGGLELTSLDKTSGDDAFTLKLGDTTSVGAGGMLDLEATYAPALGHTGSKTATFTLTASNTEDGAGTATITLTAEGV